VPNFQRNLTPWDSFARLERGHIYLAGSHNKRENGKRGAAGERGKIIFPAQNDACAKWREETQPKVWLWDLLSSQYGLTNGRFTNIIIEIIEEGGWEVFSTKPQLLPPLSLF